MGSLLGSFPDSSNRKQFWSNMSLELFQNLLGLYEQVDAFFSQTKKDSLQ
jgi:hypothetical protein